MNFKNEIIALAWSCLENEGMHLDGMIETTFAKNQHLTGHVTLIERAPSIAKQFFTKYDTHEYSADCSIKVVFKNSPPLVIKSKSVYMNGIEAPSRESSVISGPRLGWLKMVWLAFYNVRELTERTQYARKMVYTISHGTLETEIDAETFGKMSVTSDSTRTEAERRRDTEILFKRHKAMSGSYVDIHKL